MKEIPLTKGYFAQVSDEDFDELSKFVWRAVITKNGRVYAQRRTGGNGPRIFMHRQILGLSGSNPIVDHADNCGINNQRENIRIATRSQNAMNCRVYENSTTGFKGVSFFQKHGKYRAYIQKDKKFFALGMSECPKTCARTYNKAAKELHGEFACLNEVEDGPLCSPCVVQKNSKTGFRGVTFRRGRWSAKVAYNKAVFDLGSFLDPELAARAYDAKASELYGDKAKLNFPNDARISSPQ